jgi:hypothetical protein
VCLAICIADNSCTLSEKTMIAILHFLTLVITTMFAAAAAVLVNWLLLRGTFRLMRPAAAGRTARQSSTGPGPAASTAVRLHLVSGTVQAARAFAGPR